MNTVSLRAIEPEDLDLLYKIENDASLWRVGSTNVPYSRYALHDYVSRACNDIYVDRQVRLMIENADGETVGILDIVDFNPQHLRAEVGIVIESRYRRQGYARAALRQAMDYSRTVIHLHQLYAIIDTSNADALSLFSSLGFEHSATLRQWLHDGHGYRDALLMQTFL